MRISLEGRTALVGGSSEGLGRATARALAAAGADLVICARTESTLQAAAEELRRDTGAAVEAVATDLTEVAEIERLANAARDRFGTIDILVNNAGGPPSGHFDDLDEGQWRAAVDLTLMSAVELTRRLLPAMREQRWGRIINITSTSVKQPVDGLMLSNSIRSAVVGWAKTLANEVGPDRVTVNNICPGYMRTARLEELAADVARRRDVPVEAVYEGWAEVAPLGRIGEPEELAALAVFLASERAAYVHGTTIAVDGGRNQCMT